VTWDHEHVEELLAGLVLGGLDEEDATLVERALVEHVPECERCRRTLEGFRAVSGDLALVAPPVAPPEPLRRRLIRSVSGARRPIMDRRGWGVAAVAAATIAGLVAWNAILVGRVGDAESQQLALGDRVSHQQKILGDLALVSSDPEGSSVPLDAPGEAEFVMIYAPTHDLVLVMGTDLPDPDRSYQVWFRHKEHFWNPGQLSLVEGIASVVVETEPTRWEIVLITDEEPSEAPSPTVTPYVTAEVPTAL
jgi:hypothetical protein